ncbi:eukaryotic type KH-domain (KH-domain type I) [Peniophora sp. CONT]|nr:eukaryotic type KH-domain (KH-domain type I) [Peniophora sp. CONT]
MPEPESNRKRSRSPSPSDTQKQHKRANTGQHLSDASSTSLSAAQILGTDSAPSASLAHSASTASSKEGDAATANGEDAASSPASASATTTGAASSTTTAPPPPSAHIHMRCLIVTQDASIIIGKGGSHVNEIREKSGARVMVSESIPGNPERILNVSGPLDAVSKAFGLIVRRINDEPFDVPSVPGSRAVTIKFMIPNSRMGSVIGKQGSKIKEIQDASGARLNASEGMLPGSTERVLSVAGVADAIHIATYYIGNILIEANERQPSYGTTMNATYRPSNRRAAPGPAGPGAAAPYMGSSYVPAGGAGAPGYANPYMPGPAAPPAAASPQLQTQQIYIPNDLVGCIIGKGGSKINEIRHMSASQIKIMEPGSQGVGANGAPAGGENERLVVITGAPANIQMAVQLLYHRLEQEKQKQLRQQTAI